MIEYSYRGVNGIRPAGIKFEYTAEQVAELIKCGNDPIYFCKNYLPKTLYLFKYLFCINFIIIF